MLKHKAVLYSVRDKESMEAEQLLEDAGISFKILPHAFDNSEPVLSIDDELIIGMKAIRIFFVAFNQARILNQ